MAKEEEEALFKIIIGSKWGYVANKLNKLQAGFEVKTTKDLEKTEEKDEIYDGILFLPEENLRNVSILSETVLEFESVLSLIGGIEGKCVFIWVDSDDDPVKDELVNKLRLEERGCVAWEFCSELGGDKTHQLIADFFKENLVQCQFIKPAKRG